MSKKVSQVTPQFSGYANFSHLACRHRLPQLDAGFEVSWSGPHQAAAEVFLHRPKGDENGVRYIAYTPKSSTLPPFCPSKLPQVGI